MQASFCPSQTPTSVEPISNEDKPAYASTKNSRHAASVQEEELTLFPNPTTGELTVRFAHPDLNGAVQLRLTDNLGRTLHEAKYEAQGRFEAQLNLSHLPTGTYLLHVVSEQTTSVQKVIKR